MKLLIAIKEKSVKKVLIIIGMFILVFSSLYAIDLNEILQKNIGHKVTVLLKNAQSTNSGTTTLWNNPTGILTEITDKYVLIRDNKASFYIDIAEISIVRIENDVTQK